MEMLQFHCPYCGKKWFGLKKYKGLEVTCPGCRQSFKALITSEPPPPLDLDLELRGLGKQRAAGEIKKWEKPVRKGATWEVGGKWENIKLILGVIFVLFSFIPSVVFIIGCLLVGSGGVRRRW
jgi:hypothetical protein